MADASHSLTDRIRRRLAQAGLDGTMLALLLVPIVMFTLFLIIPLSTIIVGPLTGGGEGSYTFFDLFKDPTMTSLQNSERTPFAIQEIPIGPLAGTKLIIIKGFNFGVIINTLMIATAVTILTTLIGIVVAFVFARYEFPGKNLLRIIAVVPMLFTPFINAFVINKVFNLDGTVNYILDQVLGLNVRLNIGGMAGVILAQTMMFWPIAYLNIYASMVQIDPSLEEQAENLGSRGFHLFRKVTLPLSLPGIMAGAAIVFIFSMEDLAAPLAFQFYDVMSVQILNGIKSAVGGTILPQTAALALLLLILATVAFAVIRRYVTLRQYAMVQKGGRWKPRVRRPSWKGLAAIYLLVLPWIIFSATPQIGVFAYAFTETWQGPFPENPTLDNFRYVLLGGNEVSAKVLNAFKNSLIYAGTAILGIVVLSLSTAYVVSRLRLPGMTILDTIATSPIAIPGLAIATGYLIFFSSSLFREWPLIVLNPLLTGPALLFVIAYMIRRSPFATRAVFAGLQQTHVNLEESAMNLGATRLQVLRKIVLPLVSLNLLSGVLISFVYALAEVSVSVSLGGLKPGQEPITYVMYDFLFGTNIAGAPQVVAVMAVMIITVQLTVITATTLLMRQRYAFIGV